MEIVMVSTGVIAFDSPLRFFGSTQVNPSKRLFPVKANPDYRFGFASRSASIGCTSSPAGNKTARSILSPSLSNQSTSETIPESTSSSSSDRLEESGLEESGHETVRESAATASALAGSCESPPDENRQLSQGHLPPYFAYLMGLGLDLDQINKMTTKFPKLALLSVEQSMKPFVEFLVDLGVSRSDVANVLRRAPPLCSLKVEENLMPRISYLESLGFDKSRWAAIVPRCPAILGCSRKRLVALTKYFRELGLPAESLGKILMQAPEISALNLDTKIKPTTEFLLDKGFAKEEIATMVLKFADFYGLGLAENLMPKWEFFLQMNYPKSDLVHFPQYFGYSLKERIKPRYHLARKHGVQIKLHVLLSSRDELFEIHLRNKIAERR